MKKFILIAFLAIAYFAQAQTQTQVQELPSKPSNGFAFPLGSKFVVQLIPTDSVIFDLSVLSFEPFHEIVDLEKKDELFEETGEDDTIVFYFCIGTHGKTKEEKDKNRKTILIMRNYSNEGFKYRSDIQREIEGKFEETSNVGIFPNIITLEIWPYMVYYIGLKNFKKMNLPTVE